jgi:hypothetical protein
MNHFLFFSHSLNSIVGAAIPQKLNEHQQRRKKFSIAGLPGLLDKYDLEIEN